MQACAQSQPNIALIKYWGKKDRTLNIPAVPSLSLTLDSLWTRTHVCFDAALQTDQFTLNGTAADGARVTALLDVFRAQARTSLRCAVDSINNFPTAAGLASSASGFSALAVAAARALSLDLSVEVLADLTRRASGSAPRSLFSGFSEIVPDDTATAARQVAPASHWPLSVVIAVTDLGEKEVGSTEGMNRNAQDSPYYGAWVESAPADHAAARMALLDRDFQMLADLSEHSCLKMHALMMSAQPPLLYWNAATVEVIRTIRQMRAAGVPVFFTIDAGPQVKAVCLPEAAGRVAATLEKVSGVCQILRSGLGEGARIIDLAEMKAAA